MNALGPGVLVAASVAVLVWALAAPRRRNQPRQSPVRELLLRAGLGQVSVGQFVSISVAAGMLGALALGMVSRSVVLGVAFGVMAASVPTAWVKHLVRRRQSELREVWPEAIDHLSSGIRAGLSLPEAIGQLAESGPESLRGPFGAFRADYRTSGRFVESLDALKERLADPVGDRVVETLRLAREVGGGDLGRLLRTLSTFLRDDARIRGELESRQSWTVNAARLAVAAPWVLLILLGTRPAAVAAYNSAAGVVVLAVGATVSFVAYRLMMRIGRLPVEMRVLR